MSESSVIINISFTIHFSSLDYVQCLKTNIKTPSLLKGSFISHLVLFPKGKFQNLTISWCKNQINKTNQRELLLYPVIQTSLSSFPGVTLPSLTFYHTRIRSTFNVRRSHFHSFSREAQEKCFPWILLLGEVLGFLEDTKADLEEPNIFQNRKIL